MLKIILPSMMMLPLPFIFSSFSYLVSASSLFMLSTFSLIFLFNFSNSFLICNMNLTNDFLSAPLIILTMWITALMITASYPVLFKNQSPKIYLLLISLINLILILTFFSSNFILFYLLFEATLIPTLFIILGWGYQPERLQAGFYLMIYTVIASLPLLINFITIFSLSKSLSFLNFFWDTPSIPQLQNLWWLTMIMAFMVKMPMYSLHLWLPKAHVEAPVAGSMILAGLLLKLGSYGLLRVSTMFLFINKNLMPLILAISMWGAIITSMICIRQTDMKSLIAYSSVGHMGLLTAGSMTCSNWGWESSLLMMLAHGLCSSALFALANMTYEATNTRNIFLTKGMLTLFPIMTSLWFISAIANFGAPPSLNLLAEIMLFTSILSSSIYTMFFIALSAFLAAIYSLFLYTSTQHGKPSLFINPMHLFSSRNILTIVMHLIPLFTFCLKMDFVINWL